MSNTRPLRTMRRYHVIRACGSERTTAGPVSNAPPTVAPPVTSADSGVETVGLSSGPDIDAWAAEGEIRAAEMAALDDEPTGTRLSGLLRALALLLPGLAVVSLVLYLGLVRDDEPSKTAVAPPAAPVSPPSPPVAPPSPPVAPAPPVQPTTPDTPSTLARPRTPARAHGRPEEQRLRQKLRLARQRLAATSREQREERGRIRREITRLETKLDDISRGHQENTHRLERANLDLEQLKAQAEAYRLREAEARQRELEARHAAEKARKRAIEAEKRARYFRQQTTDGANRAAEEGF